MSAKTTQKFLTIYQLEEIPILSGRDLVPRLCGIFKRYLHGGQKNPDSQKVV